MTAEPIVTETADTREALPVEGGTEYSDELVRSLAYRGLAAMLDQLPAPLSIHFSDKHTTWAYLELSTTADFDEWAAHLDARVDSREKVCCEGTSVQSHAVARWSGWTVALQVCHNVPADCATEEPERTLTAVEDDAAKNDDPHADDHARCTPETCEEVQAQWLIAVREAHEEGNHNDCDPDDCEFGMRGFGAASANGAYERGLATRDGAQVYDASVEDEPHEHGCYERSGLGVLPDDEHCEGCCSVATAAAGYVSAEEPATDADRISAAIDAKAIEAAGEDGL